MAKALKNYPNSLPNSPTGNGETRFHEKLWQDTETENLRLFIKDNSQMEDFVLAVFAASPYLSSLIVSYPDFTRECFEEDVGAIFQREITTMKMNALNFEKEQELMQVLRQTKQKVALLIALCDLLNAWSVMESTQALTRFADSALEIALNWLLRKEASHGRIVLKGDDKPQKGCGYFVLALGKYGAGELNYSSDIDLIIFYDPQKISLGEGCEKGPFFVSLTKSLTRIMSDITSDGYVFRTDLRLRPDPSSTSVAISTDAAFTYYESVGQNWERAAMIKARVCAGDQPAGKQFLDELQPFIWRKYLDYAAISDVHSIKRQIDQYKGHGQIAVKGHNIKLGRGGIREIEFFVQTQQLISGGRSEALRGQQTLKMLQALADESWISQETADELMDCYNFLRRIEHRLQMIDDLQIHTLPKDEKELEIFARFAGFSDFEKMSVALQECLEKVQSHYEALFENAPALSDEHGALVFTGGEDDPETMETLAGMGFGSPEAVSKIIRDWHHGQARATRTAKAREKLTELTPSLLISFSKTSEPDKAFAAFDSFLRGLPAGIQLFSLLWSNPQILSLLTEIIGNAPRLAEILSARPRLFDAVIQPDFFETALTRKNYDELFAQSLEGANDYQDKLDIARITAQEQLFSIGVRVLTQTLDEVEAGVAYTQLAESTINILLQAVIKELEHLYGKINGSRIAVVAMGKLGGFEMSATSDLDLILIYDFDEKNNLSDGPKKISTMQYFTKLTQKLMSSISAPTAEGRIYEVDMRLRPSGNSGPLATQLKSFVEYQNKSAWTWEKMALTRARVIAGDESLKDEITDVIRKTLGAKRNKAGIGKDVQEMRQKIWRELGSENIWDIKQAPGGIIDLEFLLQYLQLVCGQAVPDSLNQNMPSSIKALAKAEMIEKGQAEQLISAHAFYQKLMQITRICLNTRFDPETAPDGLKKILMTATNEPDISTLTAKLMEHQEIVGNLYAELLGNYRKNN